MADIDQVASHTDAARIVERMLTDLQAHPHEWENRNHHRRHDRQPLNRTRLVVPSRKRSTAMVRSLWFAVFVIASVMIGALTGFLA
jgi:hypothetical protein